MVKKVLLLFSILLFLGLTGCSDDNNDDVNSVNDRNVYQIENEKNKELDDLLSNYFEALEEYDFDTLDSLSYPQESGFLNRYGLASNHTDKELLDMIINKGFSLAAAVIIDCGDEKIWDLVLNTYGYSSVEKGGMYQYNAALEGDEYYRNMLGTFAIDYTVLDYIDAENIVFYYMEGRESKEYENAIIAMENIINSDPDSIGRLKIDDVKGVRLKISWWYGNNKYGYDKTWWNSQYFSDYMKKRHNDTYEELIDDIDNIEYQCILYKTNDRWYVYPEGKPCVPNGPTKRWIFK